MKKTVFLLVALFSLVFVVKYLDQEDIAENKALIIDAKRICAFTLVNKGNRFTVKKEGVWAFDDHSSIDKIRVHKVEEFVTRVSEIDYKRAIKSKGRSKYGISGKSPNLTLLMDNGKKHVIYLGGKSAVSEDYYLEIDGNKFLVSPYYKMILFPLKNVFLDKSLFPSKVSSLYIDKCHFKMEEDISKWVSDCGNVDQEKTANFIARLKTVSFQKKLSKKISTKLKGTDLGGRKKIDFNVNTLSYNIAFYNNKLLVHQNGVFYTVDNRLLGILDTKSSDFLNRKIFNFNPKDVVSLRVGLKQYNSQDGLYYDNHGKLDADALKAIAEISYLKFIQKKKVLALSSAKYRSLEVITKNGEYSFNFYSDSKKNYLKYLGSTYELDRHCCDSLKAVF